MERYNIVKNIGEGAYGIVYKAKEKASVYGLKRVRFQLSSLEITRYRCD